MTQRKLNIAMVVPYFFPHTGGTERYVKDLATGLLKRGHSVTVISTNIPRSRREEVMDGLQVKRVPALNLLYLPVAAFRAEALAEFDVVHSHAPPFGFTRNIAFASKLRVPHVVTYHCDTTVSGKMMGVPIPRWVTKLVEGSGVYCAQKVLAKCHAIISTSKSYAETSPALRGLSVHVIPIGIFLERFDEAKKRTGLQEEARRKHQVLFVGRLAANKGILGLVQTIPLVRKVIPDVHYIIAGDGEEKPSILRLIRKLGVQDALSFYGNISIETLTQLYSTSTVFVLPSINRLEAFGIVQLEAMACSTPVIASDIPGVNSIIQPGKTGLLVPPGNVEALATAILDVLSDFPKLRHMGEEARRQMEAHYRWDQICEQVEALYFSLL